MMNQYIDMPVGLTKVKRAEATLLRHSSADLANLGRPELLDCAWALATVVTAAQQGVRLAPEVFALAESVAFSRLLSGFSDCGPGMRGEVSDGVEKGDRTRIGRRLPPCPAIPSIVSSSGR